MSHSFDPLAPLRITTSHAISPLGPIRILTSHVISRLIFLVFQIRVIHWALQQAVLRTMKVHDLTYAVKALNHSSYFILLQIIQVLVIPVSFRQDVLDHYGHFIFVPEWRSSIDLSHFVLNLRIHRYCAHFTCQRSSIGLVVHHQSP